MKYLPVFCCASESEVSLPLGGGTAWLTGIDLVKLVGGCLAYYQARLENTLLTSCMTRTRWLLLQILLVVLYR